jgi:hypothetical protein
MNMTRLKIVAKWVWISVVVVCIGIYAVRKWDLIILMLSDFPLKFILAAAVLIFAAKLCLVANMKLAAGCFQISFGWTESYRIYNLTQLAKYIPGSIWQFVGRIAILKKYGVSAKKIRDSLFAEHLWVIGSAAFIACLMMLVSGPGFHIDWLQSNGVVVSPQWLFILLGLIVAVVSVLLFLNRRFF